MLYIPLYQLKIINQGEFFWSVRKMLDIFYCSSENMFFSELLQNKFFIAEHDSSASMMKMKIQTLFTLPKDS